MNKNNLIPIGIFVVVLLFLLVNTFLSSIRQPKIVVSTPNVVIQAPAKTNTIVRTIIKREVVETPTPKVRSTLSSRLKSLLHIGHQQ